MSLQKSSFFDELKQKLTPVNVVIVLLLVAGSLTLIWVVNLIWNDVTVWGKNFDMIFFGSRASENISLGLGLQVIHYYLVGFSLLFSAAGLFFLRSWINKKLKF
jgi:hypothetical protein